MDTAGCRNVNRDLLNLTSLREPTLGRLAEELGRECARNVAHVAIVPRLRHGQGAHCDLENLRVTLQEDGKLLEKLRVDRDIVGRFLNHEAVNRLLCVSVRLVPGVIGRLAVQPIYNGQRIARSINHLAQRGEDRVVDALVHLLPDRVDAAVEHRLVRRDLGCPDIVHNASFERVPAQQVEIGVAAVEQQDLVRVDPFNDLASHAADLLVAVLELGHELLKLRLRVGCDLGRTIIAASAVQPVLLETPQV